MKIKNMLLISLVGISLTFTGCQKSNNDDVGQIIKNVDIKEVEKLSDDAKVLQASRDKLKVEYPQVKDDESEASAKTNLALSKAVEPYVYSNSYKEADVKPAIKRQDDQILSVLYEGKGKLKDGGKVNIKESVNIDAKSGEKITFDTIIKQDKETLKQLNDILNKKAKEKGIKEFDVNKSNIYFENDSIVFFHTPSNDKESVEVKVSEKEIKPFFR
ncbi:hypothetical protein Curi_c21740 [Gottschalkia acidurici 9a]|uniref:Lipoprotein n=1 Tax=Gottschalkia acidurici (strain ATCC 7906 / DSM 604 / BCRC 14475 / CIP 104303 / KCTC 5404 / NCIMB 10678 / 9a) TaxID=1128398 RepID=K0B234_GOTA9|nr:hypothetical protein [Gottschalkia acidurici]AFS79177.1 hypothetical protein Curi_c21740 [Gottschalkia acidurici 9a]